MTQSMAVLGHGGVPGIGRVLGLYILARITRIFEPWDSDVLPLATLDQIPASLLGR